MVNKVFEDEYEARYFNILIDLRDFMIFSLTLAEKDNLEPNPQVFVVRSLDYFDTIENNLGRG